ncbi:HNH endonuclease [Pseudomonas alkylphenolica]|uniref:HNH endonuclease n=1 Tax=Pseudomonas alkylphenolica TaxID=237609 RepID=A0A6I6H4G4_9PSED|nr:HNH endonuclease [Pseudomonas alkylphenolica]QGW77011.1 HNH endonuclease [Pseudomonas alkylphenolica]
MDYRESGNSENFLGALTTKQQTARLGAERLHRDGHLQSTLTFCTILFLRHQGKGHTVTKATPKDRVQHALSEFDEKLRHHPNWVKWETNRRYSSSITVDGKRYPAKAIVALALGVAETSFSGGFETTRYLRKAGIHTEPLQHLPASVLDLHFKRGAVYDRKTDIHRHFGGSHQSGIAPSSTYPAIFIFTGESGEQHGYTDEWVNDDTFLYTGEGQTGPMTLIKGNLAIADHVNRGNSLYLFHLVAKGKGHRYLGEFVCESLSTEEKPDGSGALRSAIVFRLNRVEAVSDSDLALSDEDDKGLKLETNFNTAREAAFAVTQQVPSTTVRLAARNIYQRSRVVANYVLMRAAGKCESCENRAPFYRPDGSPYLEPHHTNRVSDGGLDNPQFIAAVCPNCHREIHSGVDGAKKNRALAQKIRILEMSLS